MITIVVALVGSVVAAVGTGVLAARSIRSPRSDLIVWTFAILGLAIALGALTLGFLVGFGPTTFRAFELGGQVLAPLALLLGLAELAGKSVNVRFAGRLLLSALAVVAFAVLSTDTLSPDVAFTKTWPDATVYYETVSNKLLEYGLAPVTAVVALIAMGVAAWRWTHDPAWRNAAPAAVSASGAALALAVPGLVALLGANYGITVPLGGTSFCGLCLIAAALTLFAGVTAGRIRLDLLHDSAAGRYDDDEWGREDSWAGRPDETGEFDPLTGGDGVYRGNGLYRDDPVYDRDLAAGYPQGDYDLDRHDDLDGDSPGGYRRDELDADYPAAAATAAAGVSSAARSGIWQPASGADLPGEPDRLAPPAGLPPAGLPPVADQRARERMFGQIAIYTLLDDRVDDFDRLTELVVEQVQAREPDTLVYIVHAVPSAPLQRILYEVYRDRAAYDEHRLQPYVARFEVERRPYVLATNVIELGLQQAKVSPFPSISDLLDQTGIGSPDLLPPVPGRSPGQPASGQPASGQPGYSPSGYDPPGYSPSGYLPPESGRGQSGRGQSGRGEGQQRPR